jgi:hypothetical protein
MRLKYIFLVLLIVNIVAIQQVTAQIKVTNDDGDKIILMPDGTWRYADKDKQATASNDVKKKQSSGKAKVNKKKLTKAEKKKLAKIEEDKKRSEKIRKKLAKQRERKAKDEAEKRAKEEKKNAKLAAKKAKKNNSGKKTPKTKKPKKEKVAKGKSNKKTKKPKKTKKDNKRLADGNNSKGSKKKPSKKLQAKLIRQQFKPFKDVRIIEYQTSCEYSMNEIDAFTRKRKITTTSKFFFGYTHPKLQEFLKGENYLTCEGYMSQVGSLKSLNLKYTIDSPTAQDDYGNILEGSRLLISLLDGTVITLVSAEQDGGRIDRSKQQTIYKTFYIIDARSEKKLLKSEISEVRMVWTKGYENYEVFEVDFIINGLKCLNKAD